MLSLVGGDIVFQNGELVQDDMPADAVAVSIFSARRWPGASVLGLTHFGAGLDEFLILNEQNTKLARARVEKALGRLDLEKYELVDFRAGKDSFSFSVELTAAASQATISF